MRQKLEKNHCERPSVNPDEIEKALSKKKKWEKTCDPDQIPAEILKLLTSTKLDLLVQLFNQISETGIIPVDERIYCTHEMH